MEEKWKNGETPDRKFYDREYDKLESIKAQADEEYVAYIYGERVTDREVVLSEMHKTMAAISNDGSDIVEEQLKSMFAN